MHTCANPDTRQVVFILAPSYSGSSLLGNVLGAHPAALHIGEVVSTLQRGKGVHCRFCGSAPCPVWHDPRRKQQAEAAYAAFRRQMTRHPARRLRAWWATRHLPRAAPGVLYEKLLDAVPGKRVVIDSSKSAAWARWHRRAATPQSNIVFLWRDVRALVAARRRRGERNLAATMAQIRRTLTGLLAYRDALPPRAYVEVRYKRLVTRPEAATRRLSAALGLPFHAQSMRYYTIPHHVLGGNPSAPLENRRALGREVTDLLATPGLPQAHVSDPYYQRQPGFKLDTRWRTELTAAERAAIDGELGDLNRVLGLPVEA